MHLVFQLYGVLRFDSTVCMNIVLINISSLKLNNQIFRSLVHKYASELTTTPKAELFRNCKYRKIIGQNKSKFVNYEIKIYVFR